MDREPVPPGGRSGRDTGRSTNHKAVYSIVFGIAGFCCLFLSAFGAFALAVPSITTGIHARREIAAAGGAEGGDDLAGVGLSIGAATLLLAMVSVGMAAVLGD